MFKKKLALIVLSIISIQLSAQYVDFPTQGVDLSKLNLEQFKFGIKLTPAISWLDISHNDAQADGAALKFCLGVSADYEINSVLSVVSGVNCNILGGYAFDSVSLNSTNTKNNYQLTYSQIEIPLGLKLKTPEVNKMSYYLQGGVTSGFILGAKEKNKSLTNRAIPSIDMLALSTPSMVGYFAGVGANYKISSKLKLFGEITYKNSLTSVAQSDEYIATNYHNYLQPIEIRPAAMQFSVGLQF